ncbi:MAG: two-component regulator propeller domain-containing protein, partial [Prevotella sp.]|nr:two-component regulator propeller domain-containing protein [Prevotella sp.]
MRTYRYIITLIITLTLVGARASTSVRHFTESDGLPQSLITCVIQDRKGYIWISSWNGLSRYDGYSFSNFKARQGDNCPLVTDRILFIREVAGGDILCKCPDGYYLFKTAAKRFVALKDKKTDSGDRFRPTPAQKTAISSLPEYKGVEARILYKDRQGGYWIYTHRGLDRLTFGREKTAPRKCGNKGEEVIRAIFRDRQKRIFIADKNGFVRIVSPDGSRT